MASAEGQRKTLERYRELARYITSHPIRQMHLQKLTAAQIEQFYKFLRREGGRNGAPLSPTTVRHVHRILSSAMGAARRLDVIAFNQFEKLEKKELPKAARSRAVHFKTDELTAALARLERERDWLLPIVRLAITTGMRRGELLALRWAAVDFDKRLIHVRESLEETRTTPNGKESRGSHVMFKETKSAAGERSILLSDADVAELRAYRARYAEEALQCGKALTDNWLVFPASPVEPLEPRKPRAVSEAFSDRLAKYGLKKAGLSLHSLRHTHASILISKGVNIKVIQTRLGHAKPSITLDVYGHLMEEDQEQAVQALSAFFAAVI